MRFRTCFYNIESARYGARRQEVSINEKTCLSRMLHEGKGVKVERRTPSEECGNSTSGRMRYCLYYGTRLCEPLGLKETCKISQKEVFSKEGMKLPSKGIMTPGGKSPLKELTLSNREESMVVSKRVKLGRAVTERGANMSQLRREGEGAPCHRKLRELRVNLKGQRGLPWDGLPEVLSTAPALRQQTVYLHTGYQNVGKFILPGPIFKRPRHIAGIDIQ